MEYILLWWWWWCVYVCLAPFNVNWCFLCSPKEEQDKCLFLPGVIPLNKMVCLHGSVNFHAIALIYSVLSCGVLFLGASGSWFFFAVVLFKLFILGFGFFLVFFFPFFLGQVQMMFHSWVLSHEIFQL